MLFHALHGSKSNLKPAPLCNGGIPRPASRWALLFLALALAGVVGCTTLREVAYGGGQPGDAHDQQLELIGQGINAAAPLIPIPFVGSVVAIVGGAVIGWMRSSRLRAKAEEATEAIVSGIETVGKITGGVIDLNNEQHKKALAAAQGPEVTAKVHKILGEPESKK